ncbi:bifunctional DNA-formamidopyrimidine glycosylase/DNA-(apurinic or apyrimidinic site) lyase [Roseovarius salis]|uniref:bifunctional DNA-formamidopyrimidine glycosylase/DNA-(apurinic or apyrimidinic site) lyase n=1 Tax=Roseovarius salis TaxID=3376063 RepID=UPI0037C6B563
MPELPEVETVRRGLVPVLEGARIARVRVNRPDLRWPFPPDMADRLTGRRVLRLGRRSKYILADLDSGETLLVHLGMSGRILVSGDPLGMFVHDHPAPEKHDHVLLETEAGARVTFNDPRRFGAMDMVATDAAGDHKLLRRLGPEPLGNAFSGEYLIASLRARRTPVKAALLDQRLVAGLGNIYVCESLFRAGISPKRHAGAISARRVDALARAVRDVLHDAIAAGGSSLRDYRQADGELGYFQHRFDVYDREGAPCPRPGCEGRVRRAVQSGRSSFYCPRCQR